MKGQLVVVDLYPSLLQPEGDRGNAVLLAHRARCFGVEATATVVHPGDPLPPADIVCLGGSEDADLALAADRLRACGLVELVTDGAVVLGVGGGYALLGHELVAADGSRHEGVGLLDVVMSDTGALVSGPVLTLPAPELGLGQVSGYEYHRQVATRGAGVDAWLPLEIGHGDHGFAGCRHQSVVGCWMHGPVLPRNPDLADLLLRWAGVAVDPAGCPEDPIAAHVRSRRAAEARAAPR